MDICRWQPTLVSATHRLLKNGWLLGLALLVSLPAYSQLTLSTEVYGSGTRVRENSEFSNNFQLGNTTSLGYSYASGPHRLNTGYSFTYNRTFRDGFGNDTTFTGNTGYRHTYSRNLDFNLGHSVRAVNNNESLLGDSFDYDLRHTLTGGAGFNLLHSSLTRTRFELQGSQLLDEGLDSQGHQASGRVITSHQRSSTETLSLTGGRTIQWDGDSKRSSTADSVQLGYQRSLSDGNTGGSLGVTLYQAGNTNRTAVTVGVNRTWVDELSQTNLGYSRAISDTLTELTFETIVDIDPDNPPASIDDLETETEVVQLQQATLVDALNLGYRSRALCERCSYQLNASFSRQEVLFTGPSTFVYSAGAGLSYRLSTLANVNGRYQWRGNATTITGGPDNQQHRINLGWDRRLSPQVQARASFEHGWETATDLRRTTARLGVRIGLIN